MTFDFSLALNRWDVVLVIVVSLQTAILAYAASPKAKSVMMTLPFPFTIVTLSLGLDVDATNVLALVILFVYSHSIRLLHDRVGVPIVMAIPTGLMIYIALGYFAAQITPRDETTFWISVVVVFLFGLGVFFGTKSRAERAHRTSLPVFVKLPIILVVVALLVVIKGNLGGFASLFPLVSVVGSYEARYSLWMMSRTVPMLMITLLPLLVTTHLTQQAFGLGGGLLLGWAVFFVLLVPITMWQWRHWPDPN
ncbi:uncharacterized protein METZ01_LOCUS363331 [marine metagenome]|uniref:Uncharacterized protein n=1 Tax=marine metagenome TaxID=408172 RepID=A0A382SMN7_9ZZZZ